MLFISRARSKSSASSVNYFFSSWSFVNYSKFNVNFDYLSCLSTYMFLQLALELGSEFGNKLSQNLFVQFLL